MERSAQAQTMHLVHARKHKMGRTYVGLSVLLDQCVLIPGLVIWVILLRINAELTPAELMQAILLLGTLGVLASLVIAAAMDYATWNAGQRLGQRARNDVPASTPREELVAWRQVTAAPWRYTYLSFAAMSVLLILPLISFLYLGFHATLDQLVYALMGGIVAVTSTALLTPLLLERQLIPVRGLLLPTEAEAQLEGAPPSSLQRRLMLTVIGLVVTSVLLVAPIGYHVAYVILYQPLTSELVFAELRRESLISGAVALALGVLLAYTIARSLSTPIQDLIKVFNRVERGDMEARAAVEGSDEAARLEIYFNRMLGQLAELRTGLESQISNRTAQLEATIEVGRVSSSIREPGELIEKVTQLITDRFGYYYAAIFMIDDTGTWAELRAASGEAGKELLARHHRLAIGGKSMVGAAIQNRRGRIALDVGKEAARFNNPLLPRTHSEIALPLIAGENVIGALDVQSVERAAFDEKDVGTLQNMANQVAISIENARLFSETQAALRELRATHAQSLERGWSDLARGGHPLTFETGTAAFDDTWGTAVQIPLMLRDEKLGSILVESKGQMTAEQRELLEAVAGQAALALENARLLGESQQSVNRERLTAAITERIWSSPSVEAVLETTVREIGRALDASEAYIELGFEAQDEPA